MLQRLHQSGWCEWDSCLKMTLLACILYICNTAVSCDISKLNAILHSDNTLKTTALTVKLGGCGDGCCPFGYSCTANTLCEMNINQEESSPFTTTNSTIQSPTWTSSQTLLLSQTSLALPTETTVSKSNADHSIKLLAGKLAWITIAITCVVALILAIAFWVLVKKQMRNISLKSRLSGGTFRKAELNASSLGQKSRLGVQKLEVMGLHGVFCNRIVYEMDWRDMRERSRYKTSCW